MKKKHILMVLGFVGAVLFGVSQQTDVIRGRVVGVHDGDTLTVLDGAMQTHRIRMAEIDAPESKQDFGSRSKQMLSGMVYGREVEVVSEGLDRYKREVGRVTVEGRDVNRDMVAQGGAWVYRDYLKDQSLLEVEAQAKASKVGLWGVSESPVPPWEWRKEQRKK